MARNGKQQEHFVNVVSQEKLNDMVRRRAEEIYKKRGCGPGKELSDWLEAEKQIKGEFKLGR